MLQTLELLQVRRALRDDAVFAWPVLRREHATLPAPVRSVLALVLPYRAFIVLLWARLALAVPLFLAKPFTAPLLLGSQVAICVRFRGTFNGGSDYMTVLVLLGLTLAELFAPSHVAAAAAYAYVAVQLTFSYFIAGVAKLRVAAWREGTPLASFASQSRFGAPNWARALLEHHALGAVACWCVLAFECTFPVALLDARVAVVYIALGITFHLFNSAVFGLNRFLFAWAAAYPALFWVSHAREAGLGF